MNSEYENVQKKIGIIKSLYELERVMTDTVDWLIENHGEGIAWRDTFRRGCDGKRHPYSQIGTSSKMIAASILDSEDKNGIKRLNGLKQAIEHNLGSRVTEDFLYRVLAYYCEPDCNGIVITSDMLAHLKKQKNEG